MYLDDKFKDIIFYIVIDVGKQLCINIQINIWFVYMSIVVYKGINDYYFNGICLEFCR